MCALHTRVRCVYAVCTEALEEDDDAPFTDKKKSKIKLPFSTKKIMKTVGLKDKDKTNREKPSSEPAAVIQQPVARVQHTPAAEVQAKMQDSEEWKAFQAMQERISQVVSQTSEKVSQMEQGFESELSKLSAAQMTSPWTDAVATSPSTCDIDDQKNLSWVDIDDEKHLSWVGFDDRFDADDVTASADDDTLADSEQVNSNQQVNDQREQVSQVNNLSSSLPPPPDKDVISSDTQPPSTATDADSHVAMVTNNTDVVEETTAATDEEQHDATAAPETETADDTLQVDDVDTVDPFDVSNVVTAMTSGKPIFEVLPSDRHKSSSSGKQQMVTKTAEERRERDRQITAALIGADDNEATGARTRPRPRPQAAVKSANPFKITLAATNIESADADDDVDDAYDVDDYQQTTKTTFSAANPFARTDLDEMETANIDSGVWDPFSGDDVTTFTATFDMDDHADDVTNFQLTSKHGDKDADSRSSRSSMEEPEETLEPLDAFYPAWDGKTGWNMFLRTPLRKKLTQNRAWKAVFVRLSEEKDAARIRVYTSESETTCLHEMTLGPTFALRQMQLQQFDQYTKCHTVKLQHRQFDQYTKCHTVKLQHVFYVEKLAFKSDRIAPTLRDVTKVRDLKGLKDLVDSKTSRDSKTSYINPRRRCCCHTRHRRPSRSSLERSTWSHTNSSYAPSRTSCLYRKLYNEARWRLRTRKTRSRLI